MPACSMLVRFCSWLERLRIEETASPFDRSRYEKQGFVFSTDSADPSVRTIRLEGIGPKMLVSDFTTADAPLLRWRLELRGNNAVEFGTVPVALQVRAGVRGGPTLLTGTDQRVGLLVEPPWYSQSYLIRMRDPLWYAWLSVLPCDEYCTATSHDVPPNDIASWLPCSRTNPRPFTSATRMRAAASGPAASAPLSPSAPCCP